jgi:hypothetical protein
MVSEGGRDGGRAGGCMVSEGEWMGEGGEPSSTPPVAEAVHPACRSAAL